MNNFDRLLEFRLLPREPKLFQFMWCLVLSTMKNIFWTRLQLLRATYYDGNHHVRATGKNVILVVYRSWTGSREPRERLWFCLVFPISYKRIDAGYDPRMNLRFQILNRQKIFKWIPRRPLLTERSTVNRRFISNCRFKNKYQQILHRDLKCQVVRVRMFDRNQKRK